ncbi:MAG: ABC transporter substrate-binding protein [Microbacteriaceae bacterium]
MFLSTTGSRASRRKWALGGAAAAAAVTLLVSGCAPSGGSSSSASDTLIAYTGQAGDYQINFNPYSPSQIGGIGTIYESLFFVTNVNTNDYKPLLGTEYTWNDEGTELAVDLRDDVTWSDGEPFTADDVIFTFELLLATPSINNSGFNGTIAAGDDGGVVLSFDAPAFVSGPALLGRTPIVPEHIWADIDPTTNVIEQPIGTGPFVLDDFKAQAFTLTANPDYWDGEPDLKAVRYLSLSGNTAGVDALAAGSIDWQTGPVPDIENVATNYPGYDSITVAQNQMALLTCSSAELGCVGPQTDPAVRQAVYHAINRDQMNSLAFQNTASEISPTFVLTTAQADLISSSVEEPIAANAPDAERAAGILEDAGWTLGSDGIYEKDGQKLRMTVEVVTGWTDYITAIDTMSQQLKAAGIDLQVAQSSWNEWTDKKGKGDYELAIDSLGQGAASDPYYLFDQFLNTAYTAPAGEVAPQNIARYSDPEVDAALAVLKSTSPDDLEARQAQLDIIQAKLVEEMPYIPILTGGTTSIFNSDKFTGWPTPDDLYAFPAIWASPDNAEIFKSLTPTGE